VTSPQHGAHRRPAGRHRGQVPSRPAYSAARRSIAGASGLHLSRRPAGRRASSRRPGAVSGLRGSVPSGGSSWSRAGRGDGRSPLGGVTYTTTAPTCGSAASRTLFSAVASATRSGRPGRGAVAGRAGTPSWARSQGLLHAPRAAIGTGATQDARRSGCGRRTEGAGRGSAAVVRRTDVVGVFSTPKPCSASPARC
jgi:hypothetical protein